MNLLKLILLATVNLNAVFGRYQRWSIRDSGSSGVSELDGTNRNSYQEAWKFGTRLWVKLQLCQSKTCTKCARVVSGYGKNDKREICRRLLNYKNCCPRTTLLTRGFWSNKLHLTLTSRTLLGDFQHFLPTGTELIMVFILNWPALIWSKCFWN